MRLKALLFCLCFFVASALCWAEDYYDESITIDLGNGAGSVIVIGNSNTIYLPPVHDGPSCDPNTATIFSDGSVVLILGPTTAQSNGYRYEWKRIVLYIRPDGTTSVIEARQ